MAKRKYWFGKVITFLIAMILGVVLTVGGAALAGYIFLTKKTIGEIAGDKLELKEDVASLTLLDYGMNAFNALSHIGTLSIGEIEDAVGYPIATKLYDMLGTPTEALRASTVSELPTTLVDNLTLVVAQEKFGVSFPSIPLFEDESFLAKPITQAFGEMDSFHLDRFIVITYDDDADEEHPASSKLMQNLGGLPLEQVSSDMQDIIDDCMLEEVIDIDPEDLLYEFREIKIGNLSSEMDDKIRDLELGRVMTIDKESSKVLQNLKDTKIGDLSEAIDNMALKDIAGGSAHVWNYLGEKTLNNLGAAVDDMKLSDAMELPGATDEDGNPLDRYGHVLTQNEAGVWGYTSGDDFITEEVDEEGNAVLDDKGNPVPVAQAKGKDTHVILWELRNTKITELGAEMDEAIAKTTIGELIDIDEKDENTPQLLISLKDTKLTSDALSESIKSFGIKDLYRDCHAGILGLIDPATNLENLPAALTEAINGAVLYQMDVLDVVSVNLKDSDKEVKAKLYNATVSSILSDYINLLQKPDIGELQKMTATAKHVLTTDQLTQAELTSLGVKQGDTVILSQNTTIPAGETFEFPFNIIADSTDMTADGLTPGKYTLTIGGTVKVEGFGYMYILADDADALKENFEVGSIETAAEDEAGTHEEVAVLIEGFKKE